MDLASALRAIDSEPPRGIGSAWKDGIGAIFRLRKLKSSPTPDSHCSGRMTYRSSRNRSGIDSIGRRDDWGFLLLDILLFSPGLVLLVAFQFLAELIELFGVLLGS